MSKMGLSPVIMAGGIGSRLWPLSRQSFPKQFQSLVKAGDSEASLLQQTLMRLQNLDIKNTQVLCHEEHRFLTAEQLRHSSIASMNAMPAEIILEPCSRSTAPAVIIAALRLQAKKNNAPMVILSADHAIGDLQTFQEDLLQASQMALQGYIVTLGIVPTSANTGYGYIRKGEPVIDGYKVAQFVEKPNQPLAEKYSKNDMYLWNSGMFITTPNVLLQEASIHCPDLLEQCQSVAVNLRLDLDFVRISQDLYSSCDNISIDYALMERTHKAAVIAAQFSWCDVGDFEALKSINSSDDANNVCVGDVEAVATSHCYIHSSNKLLATLGVSNLAVVETKDAVLVANLDHSQQVKDLVGKLSLRKELSAHREVYRPWGSYDSIDVGSNYQVKRIIVNPGARLSLQRHQHRAEHWVVVQGIATVHLDGEEHELHTNQSIYIPKTSIHSLGNNTDKPLHLIEVQSGNYLGEDDIERLDDQYGRTT